MIDFDSTDVAGTFEYIEAKIRHDAEGTSFGGDFEWLCQWFLLNAPRYRGQFDKVWLWKDWPERWGTDAGIDLVARTRTGELWAIQAKADHPDRAITKREIDSFLSESNRSQFAYRLLMATTDDIGATARRTLHGQEKPVGLVLRGHFLTEEVEWPVQIGGTAARLPRWRARHGPRVSNGLSCAEVLSLDIIQSLSWCSRIRVRRRAFSDGPSQDHSMPDVGRWLGRTTFCRRFQMVSPPTIESDRASSEFAD